MLPVTTPSPAYTTVITCEPTVKVEIVSVATPAPSRFTEPRDVAPSKKSTGPVGVPPGAVTMAVNITGWPKLDGFGADITDVVDETCNTT